MRKRGFTKMDLSVAVTVVVVIVVLAVPLIRAPQRARAYASLCLDGEKQVGLALAMYAQECDHRLPLYDNGSQPGYLVGPIGKVQIGGNPVIDAQHPANVNEGALAMFHINCCTLDCLMDPKVHNGRGAWRGISHTFNGPFLGERQDEIPSPATKIIVIDECSVTDFVFLTYTAGTYSEHHLAEPANFVHTHGLNALYVDGHVQWMPQTAWPETPSSANFGWLAWGKKE
jgi:prepilin-type processing-associated H-X9-DG protein